MSRRKLMPGEISGVNKYCGSCQIIKPIDDFYQRNRNGKLAERNSIRNRSERLLIDHDHESGNVRGLLCHPCNVVLGFVRDNPDRLRALINYLERVGG